MACTIEVIAAWDLEVVRVDQSGDGAVEDGRIGVLATFVRLAGRYWLDVFPRVSREHRRWRSRALAIPDPLLRDVALRSQEEWGNVEGAAALATFAPRRHRAAATRAMACYQAAYNYLDLLGEQPDVHPLVHGGQLHSALLAALDPDAPHADYYEHLRRDDGGYLRGLLDACRGALGELPSYAAVAPAARSAAQRIVAFQSCHTAESSRGSKDDLQGDLEALKRWARSITPAGSELLWWETAAAGGSSLGIYALLALATEPSPAPSRVAAVEDAYFPWIGALHSLLDHVADVAEDRATGQHSLIGLYDSSEQAAARLGWLAERSLTAAQALPRGSAHTLVLAAMASFYLSMPQARTAAAAPAARAVLDALGWPARLTMPVFEARLFGARMAAALPFGTRRAEVWHEVDSHYGLAQVRR